jgi:mannose-6-phosphate isomerase-like protein (cupin superfamily)
MDETTFRALLAQQGYDEVLVRELPADTTLAEHHHDWDARLLVLSGELRLHRGGESLLFELGDSFEVPLGQRHAEHYGPGGATLLTGRRYR